MVNVQNNKRKFKVLRRKDSLMEGEERLEFTS